MALLEMVDSYHGMMMSSVSMTRKEYNKFLSVYQRELDSTRFFFDCHETDSDYIFGYGKLRRLGTEFKQAEHETKGRNIHGCYRC